MFGALVSSIGSKLTLLSFIGSENFTLILASRATSVAPSSFGTVPTTSGGIPSAAQAVEAKAIIPTTIRAARVANNNHLAFTPSPPFGKLPTTREPALGLYLQQRG